MNYLLQPLPAALNNHNSYCTGNRQRFTKLRLIYFPASKNVRMTLYYIKIFLPQFLCPLVLLLQKINSSSHLVLIKMFYVIQHLPDQLTSGFRSFLSYESPPHHIANHFLLPFLGSFPLYSFEVKEFIIFCFSPVTSRSETLSYSNV